MDKYLELYESNKQLDDLYINKYVDITEKMYEKNCLELIVEISELANECRCFKYWSIKTPNKETTNKVTNIVINIVISPPPVQLIFVRQRLILLRHLLL